MENISVKNQIKFAFFGSSRLSVLVLDEMKTAGLVPACIVTTPDKPRGRKLIMTANVVKTWAIENDVYVYDPAKLDITFAEKLKEATCDIFIVASYGKIIPSYIISLPVHKVLNIHPSLLPKYRGASPLQTAILDDDKHTGVTIIRIDEMMDHGPIVAQKEIAVNEWPRYEDFEKMMAREGACLLADILPDWIEGKIKEQEQDHINATFTKKFTKEDGLIDLMTEPYENFRKIQAFHEWPQAYFMAEHAGKQLRIKITDASFADGALSIKKVIPEGKKEMSFADFLQGYGETK